MTTRTSSVRIVVGGGKLYPGLERAAAGKRDFVVLRCSEYLAEVLEYCERLSPCVVLIDVSSLKSHLDSGAEEALPFGRSVHVLVSTSAHDLDSVQHLLRLGCCGVLKPGDPPAVVLKAVGAVASDQLWVSRAVLSHMIRTALFADKYNLTDRESQILTLIGKGFKNESIAERLFISPQTVRWHIRSLYTKIGAQDRNAAIQYARTRNERAGTDNIAAHTKGHNGTRPLE